MSAPEPDWLRLQKKIFTRYVQQKLRQAGNKTEVKNLMEELKTTNLLIDFAEALSGKQFTGKKPAPATQKIQQMNNASIALKYLNESCGVKTQTSAENIVDGNEKLVLGMIFQIILRFMKIEDEDGNVGADVKEALMLWLKTRTAGYNNCNVVDFTKSFHNGLPFCALIHKMRPKVINYDKLNPADKHANIALALDLGEKYMNVPKYIEPQDVEKMDEVGMVVYLSDWYYGVALLQKQDVAARRVGKLITLTELHDKMRADYKSGSTGLSSWADTTIAHLNERKFENSVEGVQKQIDAFYAYKSGEKSQKLGVLLDLHSHYDDLQVRLAHAKRPPFQIDSHLTPEGLEKKLAEVDNAELERSKALFTELARQIEIVNDGICKQFAEAVKVFQDWLAGKKAALAGDKSQPLDKQLHALEASFADHQSGYDKHIGEVEKHAKRIAERAITLNKFTPLKKEDLESAYKQYVLMVDRKRALLSQQIEESKKGGLSEEQMKEIKDSFNHFDRNKTNDIDKRELRACLQSLGQDATPKDVEHVMQTYGNGGKSLNFESFQKFMMKALGDNDNAAEIINGFKLICFDSDHILVSQLEALINDISWRQKHVDYLKQHAKPKANGLDYEGWTHEAFSR